MSKSNTQTFRDIAIEYKVLKSLCGIDQYRNSQNVEFFLSYGFTPDVFTGNNRKSLAQLIIKYFQKYGTTISQDNLSRIILSNVKKGNDAYLMAKSAFEALDRYEFDTSERKFAYDRLKNLYMYRQIQNNVLDTVNHLQDSQVSDDFELDPTSLIRSNIDNLTGLLAIGGSSVKEGDIFKDDTFLPDLEKKRKDPNLSKGITTGFKVLDNMTNGWHQGELILITGRPGQGKSILLVNFSITAYEAGYNVLYITLEMPYRQQQSRAFAKAFDINYQNFRNPQNMSEEEWDELKEKIDSRKSRNNHLFLLDAPEHSTVEYLDQKIETYENIHGIKVDMLVVDPIYLLRVGKTQSKKEQDDAVGTISHRLKILSMKRKMVTICASQINREGGKRHTSGKKPTGMDLSFTDALVHNSDMIFTITSDSNDLAELHNLKMRDCDGSTIYLRKNFNKISFEYDDILNSKLIKELSEENVI